jgi:ATPase subunit of ABC transporter with duplicated ATPase domains
VTHDQDLIEEVGTRVWSLEPRKITDFKGTYEEFTSNVA